jgi:hypothetical protein
MHGNTNFNPQITNVCNRIALNRLIFNRERISKLSLWCITDKNVYSAYEESVLEYSYIVNIHQSKNILHSSLGATTGTFDHDGQRTDLLSGSNVETKYPKFKFGYGKRLMDQASAEAGLGTTTTVYSASIDMVDGEQDYDLQSIVSSSANDAGVAYYNKVGNKKVTIRNY